MIADQYRQIRSLIHTEAQTNRTLLLFRLLVFRVSAELFTRRKKVTEKCAFMMMIVVNDRLLENNYYEPLLFRSI